MSETRQQIADLIQRLEQALDSVTCWTMTLCDLEGRKTEYRSLPLDTAKLAVRGTLFQCADELEALVREAGNVPQWQPIESYPDARGTDYAGRPVISDHDYVLLLSPAHGRVIGARVTGDVWHLIGVGCVTSESERPTHWMPLPAAPKAGEE